MSCKQGEGNSFFLLGFWHSFYAICEIDKVGIKISKLKIIELIGVDIGLDDQYHPSLFLISSMKTKTRKKKKEKNNNNMIALNVCKQNNRGN